MSRSIRRLGLVGATLAIVLIAGLNFAALDRQWDVPYVGVQEANAWGHCDVGICDGVVGCYFVGYWEVLNPCEWSESCSRCY